MSLFYYKLKRNNYFVDEGEIINKSMALQRELNNKKTATLSEQFQNLQDK